MMTKIEEVKVETIEDTKNPKGTETIETIYPETIDLPTYDYGKSQNTIDYNISIRNKPEINNKKYCFASISVNQSVSDLTDTMLNVDVFSTNDVLMSSVNGQITITKDGFYHICSSQARGNNATGRRFSTIKINTINNGRNVKQAITGTNYIQINNILYLNAGDIVQVELYQESGGLLSVISNNATYLKVYEL